MKTPNSPSSGNSPQNTQKPLDELSREFAANEAYQKALLQATQRLKLAIENAIMLSGVGNYTEQEDAAVDEIIAAVLGTAKTEDDRTDTLRALQYGLFACWRISVGAVKGMERRVDPLKGDPDEPIGI